MSLYAAELQLVCYMHGFGSSEMIYGTWKDKSL